MGKNFEKVFIPNRGVIAVRTIRTLRDLGIRAVVGYSECDSTSLAVRMADEARRLGPAPSSMSYLCPGRVVQAALDTGCDAVFPGYGFLAESADFADCCEDAGLAFIGPPAAVLRRLAQKDSARRILREAGFKVLPGIEGVTSPQKIQEFGELVGYPLLIKPVAGCGGMGTVRVDVPCEILTSLAHSRSVANIAFGDDAVCVEKLLEGASSISVQFLADCHGNAVHLGEREESIQRNYGKLLDEAPSCRVDADTRAAMGTKVASAMSKMGYVTAGTVEFLRDRTGEMYAIEVNPRIQVEHVVTEMVTRVDIIEQMIWTAAGNSLAMRQDDVTLRGHAVQCRIKAEDPAMGFAPNFGKITSLKMVDHPFLRRDEGVYEGCDVPMYYDSLLLKVSAIGEDRSMAIQLLASSLARFRIRGIKTNLRLHRRILEHPVFLEGLYDTSFLDRHLPELLGKKPLAGEVAAHQAPSLVAEADPLDRNAHIR